MDQNNNTICDKDETQFGENKEVESNKIYIDESMIIRPINLSVVKIDPINIQIMVRKYSSVSVPIEIKTKGSVARGFILESTMPTPSTITILVPEGTSAPNKIFTEPIDITNINKTESFQTKIILPSTMRLHQESDNTIIATVAVRKR